MMKEATKEKQWVLWFYIMSGGVVLKIMTMEIARILL